MIRAKARTKFDGKKVVAAAGRASVTSLSHDGAAIRLQARHSSRQRERMKL